MLGILGTKIGMTRIFGDDGSAIPITVIKCNPNEITQVKTVEKDGYTALVLGLDKLKKPKKTKKFKFIKEFQVEASELETFKKGGQVTVESFKDIETVRISATSKGKGFQGVIKRHNFSRGPETHGSHHHREPGSIGACTKPGRVHKGKKMPGRMGNQRVTLEKVKIALVDPEKSIICIKGAVPGPNGGLITICQN